MAKKEKGLVQTKNSFKAVGKVANIDKAYAYYEGVVGEGKKNEGKEIRSIKFSVKTSDANMVQVQMMGVEPEEVLMWNSDDAKKARSKNKKYNGRRVPFEDWLDNEDEYKEEGYVVLESRVGLERDEKGKVHSKGVPSFVAVEQIHETLDNGDSVLIEGNISYSTYEDKNNKTVLNKNFNIRKIILIDDVDFEEEGFEEVSYFEQEVIVVEAELDKDEKRTTITGRHINYNQTWIDLEYIVDYSDGDKDLEKLAKSLSSVVKEGDKITLLGEILNKKVVVSNTEESEEDEDDDVMSILGGKSRPKGMEKNVMQTFVSEMRVFGVEDWEEGKYDLEEDFEVEEVVVSNKTKKDKSSKLGGKSKKPNPFDDEDEDDDEDDEDLPF